MKDLHLRLDGDLPSFETFNQGSYSLHKGVVPLDGAYDIDVGIIFDCKSNKYADPVQLKIRVRDALSYGNHSVVVRRSCVTGCYIRNGEPDYHVELAIYTKCDDGALKLAKGKEHSKPNKRAWESFSPKKLTDLISCKFKGDDLSQYRRCICYIKRWRDIHFTSGAPLSIVLIVLAFHWFQPKKDFFNGNYVDHYAMLNWAEIILREFRMTTNSQGTSHRL